MYPVSVTQETYGFTEKYIGEWMNYRYIKPTQIYFELRLLPASFWRSRLQPVHRLTLPN